MRLIKNKIVILVATSIILLGEPNISDVLKEVKPPENVTKKKIESLIDLEGINQYSPSIKDDKSGKKILIKDFSFENIYSIEEKELQELVAIYKNKRFSFQEIQNIASVITKEYRDRGYFVAKAYIPQQKMKDNNLKISIVEGQYGDFQLKNKSLVKDSIIQGYLDNTKLTGTIRTASIEKASLTETLLKINDLPGVIISKANVKPGIKVGTSDFDIEASSGKSYDGYMVLDNHGGYYTGRNRLFSGININSPFSLGDKLSINGLVTNGNDLYNGSISYSFPLNYDGLITDISYSDTTYHLTEDYESLDANGNAKILSLGIKYPLLRSRLENINLITNFSNSQLEDEIRSNNDVTEKTSNTASIGLDYDKSGLFFNIQNETKILLSLTYGNLNFKDEDKKSADSLGANTQGKFSKINLKVSEEMYFTDNFLIESSLSMQYALGNKNLDGSEDFSVGGGYGVKVYPSSELSAENGYVFSTELKYQLPNINNLTNTIGVFYDRGKAFMANNNVNFESKSLQDIGVGYYTSYDKFFGQVQVAWNANSKDVTSEPNRNSRVLFQGGVSF